MQVVVIEAEKFEELLRKATAVEMTLAELRDRVLPSRMWFNREACAQLRGRPRSFFDQHPHLLPCWGIPEDWSGATHGHCWKLETVISWVSVPLHELERRWWAMEPKEQARIRKTRMATPGRAA